jgi:hypothetical protein
MANSIKENTQKERTEVQTRKTNPKWVIMAKEQIMFQSPN